MGSLSEQLSGRRVVVLGDVILDRYLHGSVDRISPEAPVPVVRLRQQEIRAGGAANVALNIAALGARPQLVTVIGEDESGRALSALLAAKQVDASAAVVDSLRPTTVKTRVLARHQQVVRIDDEDDSPIDDRLAELVCNHAVAALQGAEALVISDYAKGLLDARVLTPVLDAARRAGVPSVVDPKRAIFSLYQPATLITPNQGEIARATAHEILAESDVLAAAWVLLERLSLEAVLVTRGEAGMLLVPRQGEAVSINAEAREVFDVTGAGDTVAATLAAMLAARIPLAEAARWANTAAAISVGRLGTAAVSVLELERFVSAQAGS